MKHKIILHLVSSSGFFGAENVIITLARESTAMGAKVYVGVIENAYNPHNEIGRIADQCGICSTVFQCRAQFDTMTVLQIRRFIKENCVSVVHSHGYKSNFFSFLATLGLPVVRVATCHNWLRLNGKMRMYEVLDKYILRYFNAVVTVSDILYDCVIASGISSRKAHIIANGIDVSRFSAQFTESDLAGGRNKLEQDCGKKLGKTVIGAIGRLSPEKGHVYLLKALRQLAAEDPEISLLVIGDGPTRGELESDARHMGIDDRVCFVGLRNDIPSLLAIIDIFVLPSLIEGIPLVLLEAMAAGKSIVATRVGGIPQVLEDGFSGVLVNSQSPDEISAAVVRYKKDQKFSRSMGDHALHKVRNEMSMSVMAKKYHQLYDSFGAECFHAQ